MLRSGDRGAGSPESWLPVHLPVSIKTGIKLPRPTQRGSRKMRGLSSGSPWSQSSRVRAGTWPRLLADERNDGIGEHERAEGRGDAWNSISDSLQVD